MKTFFFLALVTFAPGVFATGDIEAAKTSVLALMNAQRAGLGLNPLARSAALEAEIQTHTTDMAEGRIPFGHQNFSLRCQNAREVLGGGNSCGEIVAWGQKTPERVHLAWTNSPGHYNRMTDVRYTHAGLGYFVNDLGRPYWGVLFIKLKPNAVKP